MDITVDDECMIQQPYVAMVHKWCVVCVYVNLKQVIYVKTYYTLTKCYYTYSRTLHTVVYKHTNTHTVIYAHVQEYYRTTSLVMCSHIHTYCTVTVIPTNNIEPATLPSCTTTHTSTYTHYNTHTHTHTHIRCKILTRIL